MRRPVVIPPICALNLLSTESRFRKHGSFDGRDNRRLLVEWSWPPHCLAPSEAHSNLVILEKL